MSQATGISARIPMYGADGKVASSVYNAAHSAATPQLGPIKSALVDAFCKVISTSAEAIHVLIYVEKPGDALEINSLPIPKK